MEPEYNTNSTDNWDYRDVVETMEEIAREAEKITRCIPLSKRERIVMRRTVRLVYKMRLLNNQRRRSMKARVNHRRQRSFGKRHK